MNKRVSKELVELSRRAERISPTSWFFIIGLALLILGALLNVDTIAAIGAFLVIVYVIIWIVWTISAWQ